MDEQVKHPHGVRVHALVRGGWLTNQHGAWAMMVVPLLVGSIIGGFSWLQLLLAFAWIIAFFFFNSFGLWMKVLSTSRKRARKRGDGAQVFTPATRKRLARYKNSLLTYGVTSGLGAAALVLLRPGLLVWAPAIAVCFLVALWQMWVDNDRSFLARASAIIASQLMAPIAFSLGSHPTDWRRIWVATVILTAYFVGTIPYVKTLIRERNSKPWIRASIGYHAGVLLLTLVLAAVGTLSWWIVLLWVLLLARAIAFPLWSKQLGKPLRPGVIGFSEFAVSTAVVLAVVLPATLF